jgi:nickel-dependent lactate racemase
MPTIQLGYGQLKIPFDFDHDRFAVVAAPESDSALLADAEINAALDAAIDSPPLDDLVGAGDSVLIVASDATRATGSAQIINLLVRRLIANGVRSSDIAIIFATGIHRPVRPDEREQLLTSFIAQRIRTIDHNAYDASQLVGIGSMEGGQPIEVNRALTEFQKVIITGGIGFHYFAGFTGGRKSICPGLASAETIEATHMLALDFERGGRRAGVGTALLDGNSVSEACERVAAIVAPVFSVSTMVDDQGHARKVFAGHWRSAHRRACDTYAAEHSQHIPAKRNLVIAGCGGSPYDINMIQAHKTLDMAAQACVEGGTIVLMAECGDGLGRDDFMKWFDAKDSRALEARLRQDYEVNGQTAWALLTKTERFRVYAITNLDDDLVRRMGMIPAESIAKVLDEIPGDTTGYVMPRGAALLPLVS